MRDGGTVVYQISRTAYDALKEFRTLLDFLCRVKSHLQ